MTRGNIEHAAVIHSRPKRRVAYFVQIEKDAVISQSILGRHSNCFLVVQQ